MLCFSSFRHATWNEVKNKKRKFREEITNLLTVSIGRKLKLRFNHRSFVSFKSWHLSFSLFLSRSHLCLSLFLSIVRIYHHAIVNSYSQAVILNFFSLENWVWLSMGWSNYKANYFSLCICRMVFSGYHYWLRSYNYMRQLRKCKKNQFVFTLLDSE